MSNKPHNGLPVVISAPSGSGKSTIANLIAKKVTNAVLSISCTTRSPRQGETEGVHYYFTNPDDFRMKIKKGEFLEWAEVHGQYYGTPLTPLNDKLKEGKDVLMTIDVQGGLSVKRYFPAGVYIFLIPPTWEELEQRLQKRAADSTHDVKIRMANARKELSYLSHYDYLVINDDLDRAVGDVVAILKAEHCRLNRVNKKNFQILS